MAKTAANWDDRVSISLTERARLKEMRKVHNVDGLLAELNDPRLARTGKAFGADMDYITVRGQAAEQLAMLHDPRAVRPIAELLSDPIGSVRWHAAHALGILGRAEAGPALIAALQDKTPDVRWTAAESLGRLGTRAAVPRLAECLFDDHKWVRFTAAQSLAKLGVPAALQPLKSAIKREEDFFTRLRLARALLALQINIWRVRVL